MDLNVKIFQWIHAGAGTRPVVDSLAVFFAEGGPWMMAALFVVLWFFVNKNKKLSLLEASDAAVFGLIINQVIAFFYFHPRPYMEGLCAPLFSHAAETSFPSDHVTLLFAAAFYLLMVRDRVAYGIFLLIIAILTAWARVYCGVHFPFDMAGSIAVAFISSGFIYLFGKWLTPFNRKLILISDQLNSCAAGIFKSDN